MKFTLVLLMVSVSGCVAKFVKPGATESDFLRDRYQCIQDANNTVTTPSCSMIKSCLAAKGYFESSSGNLQAPPGTVMHCR